jgi:OTU domain-containing protein 3
VPTEARVKTRSTRSSRNSPFVDLEKLRLEESDVKAEVARLNLCIRDVEGDGNCLFRALSDQLYGDQTRHSEIRKLMCDYLEAHELDLGYWASLASFYDGENYAAYVKRLRQSGMSAIQPRDTG